MIEHRALLVFVFASIALTAAAQSQSTAPESAAHPVPVVSFGFGPAANMISSIKNAPFSGVVTSQLDRALDDGTHINRENQEVVMRDSQGRVYRERTIRSTGASPHDIQLITLLDPSQHVQYLCTPLKICRTIRYRDPSGLRHPPGFDSRKDPNVTVEDLGTAEMNGIEVDGKRVTRTIPEETVGNDRPFTSVDESWHSKQLDINIQVKRTDPRMGTHTVTMTNIIAGEPDAKYFEIPEGYRIEPMGAMPTQPRPLEPFGPGGVDPGPRDQ
jgi:hypothetical protein